MFRIGLSSKAKVLCEELFEKYSNAGISLMEIAISADSTDPIDQKKVCMWAKQYGVTLWSYHLPFLPFEEIDISNPELAKKSTEYLFEHIKTAGALGIDKAVLHASGEPITDDERAVRMETSKESLLKLCEVGAANGVTIAVENLPRTCLGKNSAEMAELTSVDKRLRICFDTNHLLGQDPKDFIKEVGHKIITTHVSDYDLVDEKHWLPGEGKTDWQGILNGLKAVGYTGSWLYELDFSNPRALVRERDLVCEDLVRNANELFEGKVPTTFSRHI